MLYGIAFDDDINPYFQAKQCGVCVCGNDYLGLDQENFSSGGCEQHKRRPAFAFAQFEQHLCYSLFEKYHM